MDVLPVTLGEFTIAGQLGEGGSGVVYAVTRGGAALALKVLRPDLELSDREIKGFLVEAERMRRVAHPALVPVIDAGTLPDGRPFLAMPHLHGESLAQRLTDAGVAIPEPLAQALSDALSTNVDLRPGSVPAFVERIRRATAEPVVATAPTLLAPVCSPSTPPAQAAASCSRSTARRRSRPATAAGNARSGSRRGIVTSSRRPRPAPASRMDARSPTAAG
jgi:hypothetical protein